ncbi:MAG TPA: outer membrane beta-barrel protein [Phnomibacter sp.]|nr:outer membrane beta-barrel protein [Phnomibacter sp.]
MTKIFIFISSVMMIMTLGAQAQSALPKGNSQINFGVGFSDKGIPVYFGFDHAIHNNVTLGAELSYRGYEEKYNNGNYRHNVLGISGNLNYHFNTVFNIPSNWDLYAGANVGFNVYNSPDNYDGKDVSGLGIGLQVGGRYFFTNKTGINLEFGGGNAFSGGKLGLTVKL